MSNKGRIFIALSCLLFVSACGPSAEELEQRKQRRIANEARDQALFESDGFTKYERAPVSYTHLTLPTNREV